MFMNFEILINRGTRLLETSKVYKRSDNVFEF